MFEDIMVSILPFFFVFAIVYGSLGVSSIFDRRINMIIAVVLAFFAISSAEVTNFIYQVLPYAAVFFMIFFFIGFVIKVLKGKGKDGGTTNWELIIVVVGLILMVLATQGMSFFNNMLPGGSDAFNNLATLIGIVLILVIIYAAYKHK